MLNETLSPTQDAAAFRAQIEQTKAATEQAMGRLLTTFKFVPDDKLGFTPSPTARTPLHLVGHCGMANMAFATVIRGEDLPVFGSPEEAAEQVRNAGREIASREEAVRLVEESTAAVLAALDGVTPDQLSTFPNSPFGPMPFPFWMNLASIHMSAHASQIDYIQTIWGDFEDHF